MKFRYGQLILHSILMLCTLIISIYLTFTLLLPFITNHGKLVSVPNLIGLTVEESKIKLSQVGLRYKVLSNAVYTTAYPPSTIISQHPNYDESVKPYRIIYITANPDTPPEVKIPCLVDHSIIYAYRVLSSRGLMLGNITYVSDIANNAVLKMYHDNEEIHDNDIVLQGDTIDFTVGTNSEYTTVPDLSVVKLHNLNIWLLENQLLLGNIEYCNGYDNIPDDTIIGQSIQPNTHVKCGTTVNVRITKTNIEEQNSTMNLIQ